MFQLTAEERANLKSQFAISSSSWGGRRKLPYVFTEHGAVMLANVLRSRVAVEASIGSSVRSCRFGRSRSRTPNSAAAWMTWNGSTTRSSRLYLRPFAN